MLDLVDVVARDLVERRAGARGAGEDAVEVLGLVLGDLHALVADQLDGALVLQLVEDRAGDGDAERRAEAAERDEDPRRRAGVVARDRVHRRQVHRRQREADAEAHRSRSAPQVASSRCSGRGSRSRRSRRPSAPARSTIGGRGPDARGDPAAERRADDHQPGQRQQQDAGLGRRVAEDLLEVERAGRRAARRRRSRCTKIDDRRAGEVAAAEEVEVDERVSPSAARRRRRRRTPTTAPTSRPMIAAEPQPQVAPWISASVSAVSPSPRARRPGCRPPRRGRVARLGGAAQREQRRSAAAKTMLTTKIQRQSSSPGEHAADEHADAGDELGRRAPQADRGAAAARR